MSIVDKQRCYLGKLQHIAPKQKTILIQRDQFDTWHDWQDDLFLEPLHTRTILSNELCLDPDVKNWQAMKTGMDDITTFLDLREIPYVLAYSGGKGCHCHIFFDPDLPLPGDTVNGLRSFNIDTGRTVRQFLLNYILSGSNVDPVDIDLDIKKISWNKDGKGSMIRIIGCRRNDGRYKTLVDTIQATKPDIGTLPLRFPETVELWDISPLADGVITALDREISRHEGTARRVLVDTFLGSTHHNNSKCLGVLNAEKGVSEGHRDTVSTGLICAYKKWQKLNIEECRSLMSSWYARCTPTFDPAVVNSKVDRIYKMSQPYSPCSFLKPTGMCTGSSCKVIKKGVRS